jgi:hypothetical protein
VALAVTRFSVVSIKQNALPHSINKANICFRHLTTQFKQNKQQGEAVPRDLQDLKDNSTSAIQFSSYDFSNT